MAGVGGARLWSWTLNTTGTVTFGTRVVGPVGLNSTTGVLSKSTWYHLVAVRDGTNQILYVNGAAVATNASTAAWEDVSSTVLMVVQNAGTGTQQSFAEMAVYPAVGLDATRVLAHYTAGTARGFDNVDAGQRIGDALDIVDSQAPRMIQAGSRDMTDRYTAGATVLDVVREAVSCEVPDGMLFASRSGAVTFLDNGHRSISPWNTVQATFDDDGTDFPYWEAEQGLDESTLANTWNVTKARFGKVTQTATDATSTGRYFDRAVSISDLPLRLNSDALTIAQAYLAKYKAPLNRIPTVQPDMSNTTVTSGVLGLELGDKVTIFRRPIGGGIAISQTGWIQNISESVSPGVPPQVSLGVSPV